MITVNHPLVTALAVGALLVTGPSAQAHPVGQHDPYGSVCDLKSVSDPQVEGSQTGEVHGSLVIEEPETATLEAGYMTCTVQVNAPTHAGPDACRIPGPHSVSEVWAAGTCSISAGDDDNVYVCTHVDIDGHPTLYYDDPNDPLGDGDWSIDPTRARCRLASGVLAPGSGETPWKELHEVQLLVDSIVCPILTWIFPPDGDIEGIWDCPPYWS